MANAPKPPKPPEQRPHGSTNGDAQLPAPRSSDEVGANADQTAADTEQTLSDGDQTLSDADQSASEQDQAQSDADQRASDRDQAAADRDRFTSGSTTGLLDGYGVSQAERVRGTRERDVASGERAITMIERTEGARSRDEQAKFRDLQARVRDRTAAFRDQAAEAYGRALGRESRHTSGPRASAAADRARAAADRDRAGEDRRHAALDREQAQIALEKAHLDDLTGFYRLGLGTAMLQSEIERSRRSGEGLTFAYCDVDGLKRVNDASGHAAGDALLRGLASAIRSRLRSYDAVVRVGGDEFVCALPKTDLTQAGSIMTTIQNAFATAKDGASMSFGLAALRADDSLSALLERSDDALREARSAS